MLHYFIDRSKIIFAILLVVFLLTPFSLLPKSVSASSIEQLKEVEDTDNFDIGPTLYRVEANPGESFSRTLQITNRSGEKDSFNLTVGNFKGGYSGVDFLENEDIAYGAKDWIDLELINFSLEHGQRIFIAVTVKVPKDAVPGDNYAAVFLTRELKSTDTKKGQNIAVVSRAASLFVINVPGEARTEGSLESFSSKRKVYYETPFKFDIVFKNEGNIWLKPYGTIEIKSFTGKNVKSITVEPFKVYRESTTLISYDEPGSNLLPGRYTATLTLSRGYENLSDTSTITFWYLPWKVIAKYLLIIIFALILIRLIEKKFYISFGVKRRH